MADLTCRGIFRVGFYIPVITIRNGNTNLISFSLKLGLARYSAFIYTMFLLPLRTSHRHYAQYMLRAHSVMRRANRCSESARCKVCTVCLLYLLTVILFYNHTQLELPSLTMLYPYLLKSIL